MPVIVLSEQSIAQRRETIDAGNAGAARSRRIARWPRRNELETYRRYRDHGGRRFADDRAGDGGRRCIRRTASSTTSRDVRMSMFTVHETMNAKR